MGLHWWPTPRRARKALGTGAGPRVARIRSDEDRARARQGFAKGLAKATVRKGEAEFEQCAVGLCARTANKTKKKHKPTLRAQLGAAKERKIVRRSTPWMKRVKKSPRTVNKRTHACVCVCKWGRRVQPGASYGVVKRDKR